MRMPVALSASAVFFMPRPAKPRTLAALSSLIIAVLSGAVAAQDPFDIPTWAYPGGKPDSTVADSVRLHRLPGSAERFTLRHVVNRFDPPDWHPQNHLPMPDVVAHGRVPKLYACAYCHLPNGTGRPENATLAGLPEAYIVAQLGAFRSSARRSPLPSYVPGLSMHTVALNATDADVASAARYFSRLKGEPRVKVVETARIPRMQEAAFVYRRVPGGGTEPLGDRIIEGPPDFERHELRDDALTYVAYVPPGSIKRGRSIATTGANGVTTACVTCHGAKLTGVDSIPRLAGHFPTYIMRQLVAFKTGARLTSASQPMQAVVARMSVADMIAVAAYAGSLNAGRQP
jgi:cytochrome c553